MKSQELKMASSSCSTAMHRIKCCFCQSHLTKRSAFPQVRDSDLLSSRYLSVLSSSSETEANCAAQTQGQRSKSRSRSRVQPSLSSTDLLFHENSRRLDSSLPAGSRTLLNFRQSLHRKFTSLGFKSCYLFESPALAARFFSSGDNVKFSNSDSDSKDKESRSNNTEAPESSGNMADFDKSILDKDPELKSLIEDIKRDFAREKSKDETLETPKQESPESRPVSGESEKIKFETVEQIEYDYSVAEDIEEYDYINESEIGQHQVQTEKEFPISLDRGQSGVFDLDELLVLLDHLGAEDIVSFPVPVEAKFCDHMVVVSAKSRRHLQAINEEMLYIHKRKKSDDDAHLVIEGINKSDWCAMDLGNIVLHIFYGNMRGYYDIESLWTLGPDNDPKSLESDKDPYALSAEDLFWLEAAKSKTESNTERALEEETGTSLNPESSKGSHQRPKKVSSPPPPVSDSEAGWGHSPSPPRN